MGTNLVKNAAFEDPGGTKETIYIAHSVKSWCKYAQYMPISGDNLLRDSFTGLESHCLSNPEICYPKRRASDAGNIEGAELSPWG